MAEPARWPNLHRVFFGLIILVVGAALFFVARISPPPVVALATLEANGGGEAEPDEAEEPELVAVAGVPESYGLKRVRPFKVRARKGALEAYPCSDCHEDEPVNRRERVLREEHEDIELEHGGGRFWCLTCHGSKDKDTLTSLKGQPIDFDEAFLLCGQCHFQRQKDWYAGGHGKRAGRWPSIYGVPRKASGLLVVERERIGHWRGERVVLPCTDCHNSHSPSIKGFRPSPPPGPRVGLRQRKFRPIHQPPFWSNPGHDREQPHE